MANIKKSFNFRNGVQVDEDNLLVTSTGLVGIGTTVPSEALDIVGNLIVSGVTSTTLAQTGILTVATLNPTEIIGAGISIASGVITSTGGGGIVTFFGDGQYLQNLPTTQFVTSATGIALTSQNCGIGTTNAISTLQVGGDPNTQPEGVGISSYGGVKATGIITASSFSGALVGNVTGNVTGNADSATLASAATVLETARNIGGVSFDGSADITLPGVNSSGNQNTSGTATNLSGSPSIIVSGVDLNGSLDVSGNTTLGDSSSDTVTVNATPTFNQPIVGTTGENKIPSLYSAMANLPSASTYHGMFAHVPATGAAYFAHAGNWLELVNKETNGTVGTGTETYSIESLSIGTNSPANDVHLRKSGDTELQITSDTGSAGITIGRESGTNNTNNSEVRYGSDSSGADYSSAQSFDLINYGTGNFNYHLSANNASAVAGDFYWHKGINNVQMMTLTGIGGSLGIGNTQPTTQLDVEGSGKFSGDLTVGNNLDVTSALTANTLQGQLTGNVIGNIDGNLNVTTGVSTFFRLTTVGVATVGGTLDVAQNVTIQNTGGLFPLNVGSGDNTIFVSAFGDVGIKTTSTLQNVNINASQVAASVGAVSVGSTTLECAANFKDAGRNSPFSQFMLAPQVTTTERDNNGAVGISNGAILFNTTLNKLQIYIGTGGYNSANWQNLH